MDSASSQSYADCESSTKSEEIQTVQPVVSDIVSILHNNVQESWTNAVSQIRHQYGYDVLTKFEKLSFGILPSDATVSDNVRVMVQELQALRSREKEYLKRWERLQSEHRFLKEKVDIYRIVSTEFQRELICERLAHVDTMKEMEEMARESEKAMSAKTYERSSSGNELEQDPWEKASSIQEDKKKQISNRNSLLPYTNFYASTCGKDEEKESELEDEECYSSSLGTQRMLQTNSMDQFLPSALLDSPQATSLEAFVYPDEQEQGAVQQSMDAKQTGDQEASAIIQTCSSCKQQYNLSTPHNCSQGESASTNSTIKHETCPTTLSILCEIFHFLPVQDVERFLQQAHGQVAAAVSRIIRNHPSLNPGGTIDGTNEGRNTQKLAIHRSTYSQSPATLTSSNHKTELCVYYLQAKCNKSKLNCTFAHGVLDLSPSGKAKLLADPSYKAWLCPLFLEGKCLKSRKDCLLAHGEGDLREGQSILSMNSTLVNAAPRQQNYKTEICLFYQRGICNYAKEDCRFAHGEKDMRTVKDNTIELIHRQSSHSTLTAQLASAGRLSNEGLHESGKMSPLSRSLSLSSSPLMSHSSTPSRQAFHSNPSHEQSQGYPSYEIPQQTPLYQTSPIRTRSHHPQMLHAALPMQHGAQFPHGSMPLPRYGDEIHRGM